MRQVCALLTSVVLLSGLNPKLSGQQGSSGRKEIYHAGWIDLNKNGKMDVYEDPKANIESRVADLLSQMNLEEKTCQTATLYGYNRVLKDELPTPEWKKQIWKDGIANIDEHANGWGPGSKSIYGSDIKKHVWAMNEVQRFFIEDTRLGIPADFTNGGLRGVAFKTATSFPAEIGMGHTWDRELVREMGRITAVEGRSLGYTNIYAPTLDVARDQRWGRVEDTYGEDPFLTARLGVAFVTGMQGDDPKYYRVISTPKHYAVHSGPEPTRHTADVKVSKHDQLDTYLPAFRATVTEGRAGSVMCAYNSVNGQPACANEFLLQDQLRGRWNFQGYVVSDCEAVVNTSTRNIAWPLMKEAVRQSIAPA
jgi:beta-glucosidase